MSTRATARRKNPQTGRYYPNLVPMSAIRRLARRIAERFQPDKIVLFGSYAYGTPTLDSDVDLLVVMPARNPINQAVRIRETLGDEGYRAGFPFDVIVRTPECLGRRLRWGDWFLREIVTRGKVLYEKADGRLASKSKRRLGFIASGPIHNLPAQELAWLRSPAVSLRAARTAEPCGRRTSWESAD